MTEDEYVWAILERYGGMEESYHCAMYNELLEQNRQLKRALWLARAMRAETKYRFLRYMWHKLNPMAKPDKQLIEEIKKDFSKWAKVVRKCRAKADEYKN